MRIAIAISCVLAACGSKQSEPRPATLAQLISPDVLSVMRTSIDNFPVLAISRDLIDPAQSCWPALIAKVTTAYQVLVDGDSYFIVDGIVPRADVEKCVPVTFLASPKIKDDDGMLSIESPIGTVTAAWRGGFVVFGARRHVVAAIAEHDAATVARWEKILPASPTEMGMASVDDRYNALMGENVADWSFNLDKLTKTPLFMGGSLVIHYKTPADAAKALAYIEDWSTRGKFPLQIEVHPDVAMAFDAFAAAIGKLKKTVSGVELEMKFDSDQLGGAAFFAGVMGHFDKVQGRLPAPQQR